MKKDNSISTYLVILMAMTLALISGVWVIVGGVKYSIMLIGLFSCLLLMLLPIQWYLLSVVVLNFLILGPIQYVMSIDTRWLSFILGLTLLLRAYVGPNSENLKEVDYRFRDINSPKFFVFIALASVALSWLVYKNQFQVILNQVRNILFMWGIYLVFSRKILIDNSAAGIFYVLLAIAMLQVPATVVQALVVVPTRNDETAWDAVVGTFPGYMNAGGESGTLAVYIISIIGLLLMLYKHRVVGLKKWVGLLPILFVPILLGETKIVIILMPFWTFLVYRKEIIRRPIVALLAAGVSVILSMLLGLYYMDKYSPGLVSDPQKIWSYIFGFSADTGVYRPGGEIGRITSIAIWLNEGLSSPIQILLGHGLGATASSDTGLIGAVAKKFYPLHLGNTSMAVLLWEMGILGAVSAVVLLASGGIALLGKTNRQTKPESAVLQEFFGIFLLSQIPLLFYNSAFVGSSVTMQMLILSALGMAFQKIKRNK